MKRPVAHSLLGILTLRAMSGYDIRKFVKEHIGYFWKESYGQIYPMLKQMAAQGLVEARTERNSGKPDRQVYSLTRAGHVEFHAWLSQPPAAPSTRNELLLKLFFGQRSKSEDAIRHVTEFRRSHERLLQQYSQVEKWLKREHANHPGLPYWLMTLDYGRGYSRMAVDWTEATLRTLQHLSKSAQNPRKEPKKRKR
jgi:PadR family transcriptional regulator AphA